MTTVTSPTALIETHFGGIKDPRAAHSIAWRVTRNAIEHKLIDILIITICATICGANDRSAIAQYGRTKQEWLKTWLELPNGIPSPDTFNRIFTRLKPEELQKCFIGWMQAVQTMTEGELLNIDGKTLRGAKEAGLGATHAEETSARLHPQILREPDSHGQCLVSFTASGTRTTKSQREI